MGGLSNPYHVTTTSPGYDNSQPITINTYNTPTADASDEASFEPTAIQDTAHQTEGYRLFDEARDAFKRGSYDKVLALDEQAIQNVPDDLVLHEFGALCLFAQGNYSRAAMVLNALLAVAPGMDRATLSSVYPSIETYTRQLRTLEDHTKRQENYAPINLPWNA